ncbi:MAG: hypothetical protein ISEC1_P1403 [Thiomicrorhabdus sp.]|nr:MAG: hypothetical protein ISEC1_P1403 [Thiomicrorhabdus sp.]
MKKTLIIANLLLASTLSNVATAAEVPAELNKSFLEALKTRDSGDIFASIALLEKLIATQPQFKRAELELAVAYYRAALYTESKSFAKSVLADPSTPDNVKETIDLFLSQLVAEQEAADENRHRVTGSVAIGGGNDSNVNASPASSVININGLTFVLAPGSTEKSGGYGTINLLGTHTYSMPGTVGLGSRPVQREWTTSVNFYRKYFAELSDYDLGVGTLSTGINFISTTDWRASFAARIDKVTLGSQDLGIFKGINGSYTLVDGVNEYTLTASLTGREFDSAANEGREGIASALSLQALHQFDSNLTGKAGLGLEFVDAKDENKQNVTKSWNAGLYYATTNNVLVYGEVDYSQAFYDGVEPIYNVTRDERIVSTTLGATYSISEGYLADWKLNARISGINNSSNISVYDYAKTDISVDLSKQF